tara:strand:+ start:108 stop:536 length:429 start_codon:yes stop_codon:yes gene_type:complete
MKITKSQLRQIIKEEVMKEFGGAYGGRAEDGGDPYAQARQGRNWNKGAKDRYNKLVAKKMRPEDLEKMADEELQKVFPNLRYGSLEKKDKDAILHFAAKDAGFEKSNPEVMRQMMAKFLSGDRKSSAYDNSDQWLDRLKSYK